MIHLKNSLVFFLQKTHSCHTYLYLFTEQTCLIQYDGHADVRRQQTDVLERMFSDHHVAGLSFLPARRECSTVI